MRFKNILSTLLAMLVASFITCNANAVQNQPGFDLLSGFPTVVVDEEPEQTIHVQKQSNKINTDKEHGFIQLTQLFHKAEHHLSQMAHGVEDFICGHFNAIKEIDLTKELFAFKPKLLNIFDRSHKHSENIDNDNTASLFNYTNSTTSLGLTSSEFLVQQPTTKNFDLNRVFQRELKLRKPTDFNFKGNSTGFTIFGKQFDLVYELDEHQDSHTKAAEFNDEYGFEIGFSSSL